MRHTVGVCSLENVCCTSDGSWISVGQLQKKPNCSPSTHPKDVADFFKAIPVLLCELEIGIRTILWQIWDLVARIRQEHELINALHK
jgi:hypothetical protein